MLMLQNCAGLVDICIDNVCDRDSWKSIIKTYLGACSLANKKTNLTDDEILHFAKEIDVFFENWVKISGMGGMTNHIHMLGAGHATYYLNRHRNLHRYS